jgi:hypothetical protein
VLSRNRGESLDTRTKQPDAVRRAADIRGKLNRVLRLTGVFTSENVDRRDEAPVLVADLVPAL